MINPGGGHLHLIECGEAHFDMYTVYIFVVMVGLAAFLGTMLFIFSTILVAIRAGTEAAGDAVTSLVRKLVVLALRRPGLPAAHTVPYNTTLRK
jgi:hypothetical protein